MTRYMTAAAAVLATSPTAKGADKTDTIPDLRGTWVDSDRAVHHNKEEGPGFHQPGWEMDIQEQRGSVFWGPGKRRGHKVGKWQKFEITGAVSPNGSGRIGLVETTPLTIGANALIEARYEDGKLFADFRSLRDGTIYSTVLERQVN